MAATARAVDLTDVKEGGNFRPRRKPEGDYKAKIVKADDHTPKKEGSLPGWVLTIQVDGDGRSTYPYYLSPEAKQAWKIRQICIAAGLKVPQGRIRFDPNRLVNKAIGIALMDDEYDGKVKSTIDDVFPASEVGANADEEPDIEDVIDDDEPIEDDEPEDEPEPEPAPTRRVARKKPAPAPEPEPEDDDELEDEDDEEPEPTPPPRKRRAAAPPAKRAARPAPPVEDDEDDLDDLDTDDLG